MRDVVRLRSVVEPWKAGATGGLMIAADPEAEATAIGGLSQMRVTVTLIGAACQLSCSRLDDTEGSP